MKIISVIGYSGTGKTTTIEHIIRQLKGRGYLVGSIKEIHYEAFTMEEPGSNTDRHHRAGADLVTARGFGETNILYKERLPIENILSHYDQDYVILEGVMDGGFPLIVTGRTLGDLEGKMNDRVQVISGPIAEELTSYQGLEVINAIGDIERLVDKVESIAMTYTGE